MDPESAELTSFPFQYCYNFTDREVRAIALARGITAAVCAVTSFTALVILALVNYYRHRVYETVVKRLVAGFIAVSVPYQLVLALHLIHYFHPDQKNFCKADGFLNQYLESVEFLFMLTISLVLFLKLCRVTASWKCQCSKATRTCCGWKINKVAIETGLFVSLFCSPLFIDWIPFITDSYGSFGAWCWIRSLENNCFIDRSYAFLSTAKVFVGYILYVTLVFFIASLFLLGRAIKKAKKLNKVRIIDSVFFLVLMLMLYILQSVIYFWLTVPMSSWMLIAISIPLTETLTPLVLLVAIHLPLSSILTRVCYNRYTHTKSDRATMRASSALHQPSYTTWIPPHSTDTDSQTVLLASDKQPKKYGGIV